MLVNAGARHCLTCHRCRTCMNQKNKKNIHTVGVSRHDSPSKYISRIKSFFYFEFRNCVGCFFRLHFWWKLTFQQIKSKCRFFHDLKTLSRIPTLSRLTFFAFDDAQFFKNKKNDHRLHSQRDDACMCLRCVHRQANDCVCVIKTVSF